MSERPELVVPTILPMDGKCEDMHAYGVKCSLVNGHTGWHEYKSWGGMSILWESKAKDHPLAE